MAATGTTYRTMFLVGRFLPFQVPEVLFWVLLQQLLLKVPLVIPEIRLIDRIGKPQPMFIGCIPDGTVNKGADLLGIYMEILTGHPAKGGRCK